MRACIRCQANLRWCTYRVVCHFLRQKLLTEPLRPLPKASFINVQHCIRSLRRHDVYKF